ncbi:mitochondrial ribosomal protein [Spathaspora passalidarum NRRL Y-27907]|uniref:Small ribosomal subunit protein bS6m n=1 Tax=Spathaspora passalidarum (strain NRRL Y-27907 / 11-Y1) TaxID=619300 RepID=G3ANF0_SPAPN|nr:mitochondrial ribosomal protein [Spathaspora passalidarum NRRL Y-27907]EGW31939.1 mitochondrial ribosomal protein [Spathaspora passalidarum NRRL Y-27907]
MYYELFAIARITDPINKSRDAKRIATTVGRLILANRGVVRDIISIGDRPLPKIISKDHERHFQGYQFTMGFDCSSNVQEQLLRTLRQDPRILRANIMKHDLKSKLNPGNSMQQALDSVAKS